MFSNIEKHATAAETPVIPINTSAQLIALERLLFAIKESIDAAKPIRNVPKAKTDGCPGSLLKPNDAPAATNKRMPANAAETGCSVGVGSRGVFRSRGGCHAARGWPSIMQELAASGYSSPHLTHIFIA